LPASNSRLPSLRPVMLMPFGPALAATAVLPANDPAPSCVTKLFGLAENTSMPLFDRSVRQWTWSVASNVPKVIADETAGRVEACDRDVYGTGELVGRRRGGWVHGGKAESGASKDQGPAAAQRGWWEP